MNNKKCPSCLAGFSREDMAGNCTCDDTPQMGDWRERFDEKFLKTGDTIATIEGYSEDIKSFISSVEAAAIERILSQLERSIGETAITGDKVGSFADGYNCLKEQVLHLIARKRGDTVQSKNE